MRFKAMATMTAAIFVIAGLGFAFEEMSLLKALGVHDWLSPRPTPRNEMTVWVRMHSFVFLLGTVLFGCGLLAWAIRNLKNTVEQTNAALALFGLNIAIGISALAQQINYWRAKAGWGIVAVFIVQAIGYGWLLLMKPKASVMLLTVATDSSSQALREQWAQQIHEAAAQAERNRLARELHDSIKQQLFSINVNAATVQARWENDETGAKTALDAVRGSVREAMAEMEAMLHSLRPAPLENVGLVAALRQQCESLQYRTGANVTAEIGELPTNQELSAGAQDALFRIAQETLANIARHARARNVRVRLYRHTRDDEDSLWLKIQDDGSGFDVGDTGGMGLANIRSRALEIGGSLHLESQEGEGTSLTIRVPLVRNGSHEVRRELHVAFVFTLVGFLLAGSWILDHTGAYWPLAGLSIFALSGLGCYRAARSIQRMKTAGALPPKQILELQSQLSQVVALLIGALMWSLENWHIIAEKWHVYIPNETFFLLAWPLLAVFVVRRVHQILRVQAGTLTAVEFLAKLNHWQKRVAVFLVVALLFLFARPGILAYPILRQILIWQGYGPMLSTPSFQPLRVFWLATLALLLYWLYLAAWQLWLKGRAAKAS